MKPHLPVLDGLRGTAALSVLIYHLQEFSAFTNPDQLWLRHGYLAVDFFFCLSGYVIGYAYDGRRAQVGIGGFFVARLIRLHPMVMFGAVWGLISYLFDPYAVTEITNGIQPQSAPAWRLIFALFSALLLIPAPPLPNRSDSISLNSPSWSLMMEYLANIVYAVVLWRLRNRWLVLVVLVSAFALGWCAHHANTIALGWGLSSIHATYALVRIGFSFSIGLLLFRSGAKWKTSFSFGWLSLALVLVFFMPGFGLPEAGEVPLNWLYETVVLLLILPLIVALGAGAESTGFLEKLCNLCGRISYPMYMLHYAVITCFVNYQSTRVVEPHVLSRVIAALAILIVAFSYAVLTFYDEPLRAMLKRRFLYLRSLRSNDQSTRPKVEPEDCVVRE
jgi:peptidoglycan/LPS O-acetylase OafA/YrhL